MSYCGLAEPLEYTKGLSLSESADKALNLLQYMALFLWIFRNPTVYCYIMT